MDTLSEVTEQPTETAQQEQLPLFLLMKRVTNQLSIAILATLEANELMAEPEQQGSDLSEFAGTPAHTVFLSNIKWMRNFWSEKCETP